MNYILNDRGEPLYEPNLLKWASWFEHARRRVRLTNFGHGFISTVFLGIDHNYRGTGTPVLWETMVFGNNRRGVDLGQWRCSGTREQALAMHASICFHAGRIRWSKPISRRQALKTRRRESAALREFAKAVRVRVISNEKTNENNTNEAY